MASRTKVEEGDEEENEDEGAEIEPMPESRRKKAATRKPPRDKAKRQPVESEITSAPILVSSDFTYAMAAAQGDMGMLGAETGFPGSATDHTVFTPQLSHGFLVSGSASPLTAMATAFPLIASEPNIPQPATPSSEPEVPPNLVLPCVSAYWSRCYFALPMLHRGAFEAAFAGAASDLYGPNPPMALLCAIAGTGTRLAYLPGVSDEERKQLAVLLNAKARDLLMSGYLAHPTEPGGVPPVSDLEAVQALLVLFSYYLPEGSAQNEIFLLEQAARILGRMCIYPDGTFLGGNRESMDHIDWLRRDLLARIWIVMASVDMTLVQRFGDRAPFLDYLGVPFLLPSHETFFGIYSSVDAYQALLHGPGVAPVIVDCTDVITWSAPSERCRRVVREIVAPISSGRAGVLALGLFHVLMRDLWSGLAMFATSRGLVPPLIAAQDPDRDTLEQATYRHRVGLTDTMASELFQVLPDSFGIDLAEGRTDTLFANAEQYLSSPLYAALFLTLCICNESKRTESWVHGASNEAPDEALLSSQPFVSSLEASIRAARMIRGLLQFDTSLEISHHVGFSAVGRIGFMDIAVVRKMRHQDPTPERLSVIHGLEDDVRIVQRYFEGMGRVYRGFGQQFLPGLKSLMAEAGIAEAEAPQEGFDSPQMVTKLSGPEVSFASSILYAEHFAKLWLQGTAPDKDRLGPGREEGGGGDPD